jgi:hypothetical protein
MLFILEVELKQQKQYENFLMTEIFKEETLLNKTSIAEEDIGNSGLFGGATTGHYFKWFSERLRLDKSKIIDSFVDGFKQSYFLEEEVL